MLVPFLNALAPSGLVALVKYNPKSCQVELFLAFSPELLAVFDTLCMLTKSYFVLVGTVDPALLQMPENEINPRQISIRNLILLAEAKEKKWVWFSSPLHKFISVFETLLWGLVNLIFLAS